MKRFALIGAAGYVAPRHLTAIHSVNGDLTVALDPHDSVGVLDSYYPNALYFREFERFDRYVDKARREGKPIDYFTICSPNYLHDSHIRFALRSGAHVICEKPMVINPWNIDAIQTIEQETGKQVNTILQLRLHPDVIKEKQRIDATDPDTIFDVDLLYITSRGRWYLSSWKGDNHKSGGIAMNIGIHFFDLLFFLFGEVQRYELHWLTDTKAAGYLELKRARVRWILSIDANDLPKGLKPGQRTYRSIKIGANELELSAGFTELHEMSYASVLAGQGFGSETARPSVETVYAIRQATPQGLKGDYHPYLKAIAE